MANAWLLRLSLAQIERWAQLRWCWRALWNVRARWHGILCYETGRDLFLLKRRDAWAAMSGSVLEGLLDRRIHVSQQKASGVERVPDLVDVGRRVAAAVERIRRHRQGRLVILSPFHYVSQYANVLALHEAQRALRVSNLAIVSGVPRNRYGSDEAIMPGMEVLHTLGDGNRNSLGIRLARALVRDGMAVLFADAAPYAMQRYPMDTIDVRVLDRPARIHAGVFRLGRRLDAVLLPFYLTFKRGKFDAVVLDPIELAGHGAPQHLADAIGAALANNYARSLFAGYPALYGFAPVR